MPPLLLAFFFVTFIYYLSRHLKVRMQLSNIPGPTGHPLLGCALDFVKAGNEKALLLFEEYNREYGQRFKLFLGLQPYVIICNGSDAEKLLTSQNIDKSRDYDFLMPWLGTGLLTSAGIKWHSRRKLLTPTFHFKILEDFLVIMKEQANVFVDILSQVEKKKIDIFPNVTHAALDVICETAMGKKLNAQHDNDSVYVRAIYRISELIQRRQLRPWLHPDFIWSWSPSGREEKKVLQILHDFSSKVIKQRKKEATKGKKKTKKLAFLDLLIETDLTEEDIREEVDTFMFEGHDTTASGISFCIFLLGHNPQCQRLLQEELDSIDEITMDTLPKLKYLEMCIKESLRLYPSVPMIGRKINEDLVLDENTTIPPGTIVTLLNYCAHRDGTVFKDPEEFRPQRFSDVDWSPFAYLPFSAGARNCIGQKFALMEEKVFLATLFKQFQVTSLERREDVILLTELILRPKDGLKVRLTRRD